MTTPLDLYASNDFVRWWVHAVGVLAAAFVFLAFTEPWWTPMLLAFGFLARVVLYSILILMAGAF